MKTDRFLGIYGWVLVGMFLGCLYTLYVIPKNESHSTVMITFGSTMAIWYLATGIGILKRTLWGYYLFRSILCLLFISFPIGTFISYKSLRFMKKHRIKQEFGA